MHLQLEFNPPNSAISKAEANPVSKGNLNVLLLDGVDNQVKRVNNYYDMANCEARYKGAWAAQTGINNSSAVLFNSTRDVLLPCTSGSARPKWPG